MTIEWKDIFAKELINIAWIDDAVLRGIMPAGVFDQIVDLNKKTIQQAESEGLICRVPSEKDIYDITYKIIIDNQMYTFEQRLEKVAKAIHGLLTGKERK